MAVSPLALSSPFEKLQKIKWETVQLCDPKIGEGSYAKVYDLKWNGTSYAGKKFKPSMSTTTLGREIQHWFSLRHPNIVPLYGVTFKEEDESKPLLVMEKMEISLSRHLKETGTSNQDYTLLPFVTKVSILSQVAKALAHIHFKKLLHGDLTANNVLLSNVNSGSVVAKVSDFGMSRSASETVSTATLGSLCYLPPEVDDVPPDVTQKVDVYSFGVLAIHCITHKCPKRLPASKKTESGLQLRTEVERFSHVLKEFRTEDKQLLPLIERCIHNDPRRRPEADTVCREVAYLEESMRKSASESPGYFKSTSAPVVHYSSSISLRGCNMDSSTLNLLGANYLASQPPSEPDQNEVERANISAIGSEQPITCSPEESTRLNEGNLGRFSSISGGRSDHQLRLVSKSDSSVPAPHGAVASGSQKRGPRALQTKTATPKPLPDPLKFECRKIANVSENPLNRQYSSYIPKYQYFSDHGVDAVEFETSLYFYQFPHLQLNRRNKAGQLQEILFQHGFDSDHLTALSVAATANPPAIHVVSLHHYRCYQSATKTIECSCSVDFVVLTLDLSQSVANSNFIKNQITPLPVPKFLLFPKVRHGYIIPSVMLLSIGLGSLLIVGVVKEQQVILMGIDLSQHFPQWTVLSQFTFSSIRLHSLYIASQLLQFNNHILITCNKFAKMVPLEDVQRAVMTNSTMNKNKWQPLVLTIPTECGKLTVYRGHLLCVGGTKSVEMAPSDQATYYHYNTKNEYKPQGAVYVYSPDSYDPEWKYVGCLNTPRTGPALFVKDDRLYVVGGQCMTNPMYGDSFSLTTSSPSKELVAADEVSVLSPAITENNHVEEPSAKRFVHTRLVPPPLPFPHAC